MLFVAIKRSSEKNWAFGLVFGDVRRPFCWFSFVRQVMGVGYVFWLD
jgi:hypothetical protein